MAQNTDQKPGSSLGTFAGVFTPSILTILGIILFLRLGYVVGNAGMWRALVIIGMANAISVLTSVSLSAVATNIKVKGGGDYYLISRTLGPEFGGAIGLVLFLAQAVSIAFYCIGFGEAVQSMLPGRLHLPPQGIAAMAMALLFILSWMGADIATKFQYLVMALLLFALASFFSGGLPRLSPDVLAGNWAAPQGGPRFWTLFAIFFPAVTGFTQGVSMSGDLKDPGKSLPRGTFLAVFLSIVVYFGVALVFGASLPLGVLGSDYGAMKIIARWPVLIDAGVIAATLSSAMASFLGAPRILQALAQDRVFSFLKPFAKGSGPANNPRRGVLLAGGIALATTALGNLNLIASVVSMFFLISYGLLNYATYFEAKAASPSFRPRFRFFNKHASLFGCLACLGAMLAIDPASGAVAIALLFAIYQYLLRTVKADRWADSQRSHHLQEIRKNLLATTKEPEHFRDWRPQILAFSDDPERRPNLLRFSSWLEGGSGMTTAVRILLDDGPRRLKAREEAEQELRRSIAENSLHAFPLVVTASNVPAALETLFQSFGIGPIKANTALLNWFMERPYGRVGVKEIPYGKNLRTAFRLGMNIVLLSSSPEKWEALEQTPDGQRRIDVWWFDDATSRLMLLLAYLVTRSHSWEDGEIRLIVKSPEGEKESRMAEIAVMLDEARIAAVPLLVEDFSERSMKELSQESALVFCPFRLRANNLENPFGGGLETLLKKLPVTALILAAKDVDLAAEPDEGKITKAAAAMDAYEDAVKNQAALNKAAEKAAQDALAAQEKLSRVGENASSGDQDAETGSLEVEAQKAQDAAETARRKAAKAAARTLEAARCAESLDIVLEKSQQPDDQPCQSSKKNGQEAEKDAPE